MKIACVSFFILFVVYGLYAQDLSSLKYKELDSLMMLEYNKGTLDKAIPYMQAGRDKAKKEFGEMDSVYAEYTNNLGVFYYYLGQFQKAEQYYVEAQNIRIKTLGENHPDVALSMNVLGLLYKDLGEYEKAEQLLLQSKNIRGKVLGEQDPNFATSLNNLAMLYFEMGNYEKAEQFYLQAKDIWTKVLGEEHPHFANSLNNLAVLYVAIGHYEKAEPLYLQAKNIVAKAYGEQHPNYAATLNGLANMYSDMGDNQKAELLLLQSKDIIAKSLGEEHPNFASSLDNLAAIYQSMGNYKAAVPIYLQAKKIREKTLGEMHPAYAHNLTNLAFSYESLKNYTAAEALLLQAKDIYFKIFGEKNAETANNLSCLAAFYRTIGQLDTALFYSQWSIIALSAELDSGFQNWGQLDQVVYLNDDKINNSIKILLTILYKQYQKSGDKNKLELYYQVTQSAIRLNERIRNGFSGEDDKLRVLASNNDLVLKGIHAGMLLAHKGYEKQAFAFAEMNKGVLLMDAAKTTNAYKFGNLPDSLVGQERKLQKTHSDLEAQLLESRSKEEKDSLLNVLNKNNQEIALFTKVLKSKYPQYAALKYENKSAGVDEIQRLLDAQTALLEYVIGDSTVYIFYIDKQNVKLVEMPIRPIILASKIKDLHQNLSDYKFIVEESELAYKRYTENAYWFYENLIAPVLKSEKEVKNLIIVSDGELGHLPFEAFLVEPAPQSMAGYAALHYLVKDYKISYNYSATLWQSSKNAKKLDNNGQLFSMASNYKIKIDSAQWDSRLPTHQRLREGLGELPAARKEVEILAETFNGFLGLDKDASEKNFKEKAGDYAVIHLAMHGLLDAKNPILSSLAFTEDGDSLENNFLQAYEISKMKLNADLVVLSACETGYGKFEKGNGIASLAQAFAYAGAPAMIVSLWQVNDYATSEIMKNLYQNLADGMDKDAALQEAKLHYIQQAQGVAAHPAFWSSFILMGNTDAITLGRTHVFAPTWIIGIILGVLALVGGVVAMRRKRE